MIIGLMPFLLLAQKQDTCCSFKLTIEVYDLDLNAPLAKSKVKLTGTNGQTAEFFTNDTGAVIIDGFIQPATTYTIEVSCKGYLTGDQQRTITSQLSTIGRNKSAEFWKVFKLRQLHYFCLPPMPQVVFVKNSTAFQTGATDSLECYVHFLRAGEQTKIEIVAYTNQYIPVTTAKRRIDVIKNHLLSKGIAKERIIYKTEKGDNKMVELKFRSIEYKE